MENGIALLVVVAVVLIILSTFGLGRKVIRSTGSVLGQILNLILRFIFMGVGGVLLILGLFFPFLATSFFTRPPKTLQDLLAMLFFFIIILATGGFLVRAGWRGFLDTPKNKTWTVDFSQYYYKQDFKTIKNILETLPELGMNHRSLSKKYSDGSEPVLFFTGRTNPDGTDEIGGSTTELVPKVNGIILNSVEETYHQLMSTLASCSGNESTSLMAEIDDTMRIHVNRLVDREYRTKATVRIYRLSEKHWMVFSHG